jgi:hypothetical protein
VRSFEIDMSATKENPAYLIAIIGSIVSVVATDLITEYLGLAESMALWGIAGAAFLVVALFVGWQSPGRWRAGAALIAMGITLGVIMDAVIQEGFRGHSRNMWPLGVIFFLLLAVPTSGLGLALGRLIARARHVRPP